MYIFINGVPERQASGCSFHLMSLESLIPDKLLSRRNAIASPSRNRTTQSGRGAHWNLRNGKHESRERCDHLVEKCSRALGSGLRYKVTGHIESRFAIYLALCSGRNLHIATNFSSKNGIKTCPERAQRRDTYPADASMMIQFSLWVSAIMDL